MKLPRECRIAKNCSLKNIIRVVDLMDFHQTVEYEYFRSIAIDTEIEDEPIFLGIVGISIFKTQINGTRMRKKLIKGPTLSIESHLDQVDPRLLELDHEDVTYQLSMQEYNILQTLVHRDPIGFWTYKKKKKD